MLVLVWPSGYGGERTRLAERRKKLGKHTLEDVVSIIKPDTIRSVIIRGRAMSCSFRHPAQQKEMTARWSLVNGLVGCSNTTSERPHELFDHKG